MNQKVIIVKKLWLRSGLVAIGNLLNRINLLISLLKIFAPNIRVVKA